MRIKLWRFGPLDYWTSLWYKAIVTLVLGCWIFTGVSYSSTVKRSALTEFRRYEVLIPRIYSRDRTLNVTAIEGVRLPGIILVEFSAFQRNFSIQLIRNKYFISDNYTEKIIRNSGEVYRGDPQIERTCYYTGHLVGHQTFRASFSACSGLRGYVRTDTDTFHLEPWDWSSSGRHYAFRDSDYTGLNLSCGHKGQNLNGRIGRSIEEYVEQIRGSSGSWMYDNKTRIVELYMAADYAELASFRGNATKVFRRMKEIVNIVSSLYIRMNILVVLVGAEVWEEDRMDVVVSTDKTLTNFLDYRRFKISPRHQNDNAQLITGRISNEGITGKAPIMTMCTLQYSGGVTTDYTSLIGPVASALAHQLGHNLGLLHDTELCDCQGNQCIMSAFSGGRGIATKWSDCSKQQFSDAFHQGMDYCLLDKPPAASGDAVCGNGVAEEGEDCDCGLPEDCSNHCCNASSCTVMGNATCAAGGCCDLLTCQLQLATTECRMSKSDCDLSEYCDGVNPFCPTDVYSVDGSQCSINAVKSFCYHGKCKSHDSQCKLLWGATGQTSHDLCFEQYNILGNVSGHCGADWLNSKPTFRRCEPENAICGMLHCHHLNEKLMFWKENLAYSLPEASVTVGGARHECRGAIVDVGLGVPDPGMVPNGAACGKGKACFNQQCLDVRSAFPSLCPDCHGHGICNSIGQCHCYAGYAPPYCDKSGNGGSLHGGPIKIYSASESDVGLIVGLCVFFLLLLLLLLLLAFCIFRHRQRMKYCWVQRQPDNYSSVENVNICVTDSFEVTASEAPSNNLNPPSKVEEVSVHSSVPVPPPKVDPEATLPSRRPVLPSRPMSVVLRPNPPSRASQAKRASSITTQDISSPLFVSSTNINLNSTLPLSKIKSGEFHSGLRKTDGVEQRSGNDFDDAHTKTLPNLSPRLRGTPLDSRHVGVRSSCVDAPPSELCFSPTSNADTSVRFTRPQPSLPVVENVYEEIKPAPVCPKIAPPNPPISQPKLSARDLHKRGSQVGGASDGGVVPSGRTANASRTGVGEKSKTKPSVRIGDKETEEQKLRAGVAKGDDITRATRQPRRNSNRSSSTRSSAANNDTSASVPLNSDFKQRKVPKERTMQN